MDWTGLHCSYYLRSDPESLHIVMGWSTPQPSESHWIYNNKIYLYYSSIKFQCISDNSTKECNVSNSQENGNQV